MSPEVKVGVFALAGLTLFGCWRAFRWFQEGKPTPNPWDERTEESIHQPDATPICTRCLEPHEPEARFCSNCGVPVDPLVPFSPYPYIFACGDMLRSGTTRRFQINWITVTGFLLLPLAFFPLLFAFVYWFFFLRNLQHQRAPIVTSDAKSELTDGDKI